MTKFQTASKCIRRKIKMNFITYCALVFASSVLAAESVTGQNRFLRYAPMVERMIKQLADKTIESECDVDNFCVELIVKSF